MDTASTICPRGCWGWWSFCLCASTASPQLRDPSFLKTLGDEQAYAIIGYSELMIDGIYGETPEKAQAVLKRVESNGRHLINDVLDFSKIEAGQLKLAISEYSMKDVVYNVYSAVEPLAVKKNLNFKVQVPPDMRSATVTSGS